MKWLLLTAAVMTFASGLIVFWLPIPLGIPLMIISAPVLMKHSAYARNKILSLSALHPEIEKLVHWLDKRSR